MELRDKRVLTLGTFDATHAGHIHFLKECAAFGQLHVGLNSDRFVSEYKGSPLFYYTERRALIKPFCYMVWENDGPGKDLIAQLKPDILAIGSDWLEKDYLQQIGVTRAFLDDRNIKLLFIPYTPHISTTEIKRRCKQSS